MVQYIKYKGFKPGTYTGNSFHYPYNYYSSASSYHDRPPVRTAGHYLSATKLYRPLTFRTQAELYHTPVYSRIYTPVGRVCKTYKSKHGIVHSGSESISISRERERTVDVEEACDTDHSHKLDSNKSNKTLKTIHISRAALLAYKRLTDMENDDWEEIAHKSSKEFQTIMLNLKDSYKQNMICNAQLDNEKQALVYYMEDIKDQVAEQQTELNKIQADARSWNRQIDDERRKLQQLDDEEERLKQMLKERDDLIKAQRLVLAQSSQPDEPLLAEDTLKSLTSKANSVDIGEAIKTVLAENSSLKKEIKQANIELDIEKESNRYRNRHSLGRRSVPRASIQPVNTTEIARIEREQLQLVNDAKKEVNTSFLRIAALENQLSRLETQMHKYREICTESEKQQASIKSENKKLSRQVEDAKRQVEDLSTEKSHLETRIDKITEARKRAMSQIR